MLHYYFSLKNDSRLLIQLCESVLKSIVVEFGLSCVNGLFCYSHRSLLVHWKRSTLCNIRLCFYRLCWSISLAFVYVKNHYLYRLIYFPLYTILFSVTHQSCYKTSLYKIILCDFCHMATPTCDILPSTSVS